MPVDREFAGCAMVVAVKVARPRGIAVDFLGQALVYPGIPLLIAHPPAILFTCRLRYFFSAIPCATRSPF